MELLKYYGKSAAAYFQDENLDTQVVTYQEVDERLSQLKPQPLPKIREKILLEEGKWLNYQPGQHEASVRKLDQYKGAKGIAIKEGALSLMDQARWKWNCENQTSRVCL